MDALTYFFLNYGLYGLLLVAPAALLGVMLGWLVWGKHQAGAEEARKRREEAERAVTEVELTLSQEREQFKLYRDAAEEGGVAPAATPEVQRELAALRVASEEAAKEVAAVIAEREAAAEELAAARKEREEMKQALAASAKGKPATAGAGLSKAELKKMRNEKRALEKGLAALRAEKDKVQEELASPPKAKAKTVVPVSGAAKGDLKRLRNENRELEKKLVAQEKLSSRRIGELEKKVATVEAARTRKAEEARRLQQERAALEGELKETRAGLEGELKTARALVEEERKTARTAREKEEQAAEAKIAAEVMAKEELRRKSEKEGADLKAALAGVEERLGAVESERDGKAAEITTLRKEKEDLAERLRQEEELRGMEKEKRAEEFDALRAKQEELEAQMDSLAKQKEQAAADVARLSKERSELQGKVMEAQSSATVAEAKLREVSGDKKGLTDDLAAVREERDEFKATLDSTEAERSGLAWRVGELEGRIQRTESELEALGASKAALEEEVTEAKREAAMVRVDLELLQRERETERGELEEHRAAQHRWADELHRLREEKKELNQHIAILGGDDSKAEVLIKQIKAEKERILHDLVDQQNERQQVEDVAGMLRRELHGLRHELVEAEARAEGLAEARQHLKEAEERLARTQADLARAMDERRRLQARTNELEESMAVLEESEKALAAELSAVRSSEPRENVPAGEPGRSAAAADDLRASLGAAFRMEAEEESDGDGDRDSDSGPEPGPQGERSGESLPGAGEATARERADAAISGEDDDDGPPAGLEAGLVEHQRFGMVYPSAPAASDDLTQIKGVGEVIAQKLSDAGIHTYWQIAKWRAPQVRAVSAALKLRDRVKRYHWQKQARELHKEKYGEGL